MHLTRTAILIISLVLVAGCTPPAGGAQPAADDTSQSIIGNVVKVDLEGGFYGLIDTDGNRYDPDQLPNEFRIDGLAVRARLQTLPPVVGFHMWGKKVHLLAIERR